MAQQGMEWTLADESRMIAILATTKMSSDDADTVFSHMFGRTKNAIHMRRVKIAQNLLRNGHNLPYVSKLMHLPETECLLTHGQQ